MLDINANTVIQMKIEKELQQQQQQQQQASDDVDSNDTKEYDSDSDSDDESDNDNTDLEPRAEGKLEQINQTQSNNYLFQSKLKQERRIGLHSLSPNQQRMAPHVIDTSSKGSLGTIASLPESQLKNPFQYQFQ